MFGAVGGGVMVAAIVGALLMFQPFAHVPTVAASALVRPTPAKTTKPSGPITPLGPIATVPGSVVQSTVRGLDAVIGLNFLTADQVAIYRSTGAVSEVDFALARSGPNRIVTLVVRRPTTTDATRTTERMAALLLGYGMTGRTGTPTAVHVQANDGAAGGPLRRAEYTGGDCAVYLEVQGPDSPTVDHMLTSTLAAQLATLPAR